MHIVHRPVFVGLCQNAGCGGNGQVASLDELKTADTAICRGMLWCVWTEIDYRLGICLVTWKFNDKTNLSCSALQRFESLRISDYITLSVRPSISTLTISRKPLNTFSINLMFTNSTETFRGVSVYIQFGNFVTSLHETPHARINKRIPSPRRYFASMLGARV
jgi:hypothetical protein